MRPEGIEGAITSAGGLIATVLDADVAIRFRFLVESYRRRLRVSPTRFRASTYQPFSLAVFDSERRR